MVLPAVSLLALLLPTKIQKASVFVGSLGVEPRYGAISNWEGAPALTVELRALRIETKAAVVGGRRSGQQRARLWSLIQLHQIWIDHNAQLRAGRFWLDP